MLVSFHSVLSKRVDWRRLPVGASARRYIQTSVLLTPRIEHFGGLKTPVTAEGIDAQSLLQAAEQRARSQLGRMCRSSASHMQERRGQAAVAALPTLPGLQDGLPLDDNDIRLDGAVRRQTNGMTDPFVVETIVHFLQSCGSPSAHEVILLEDVERIADIVLGCVMDALEVEILDTVPPLVRLLESPHDRVREQAARALGRIAGHRPEYRDLVLSCGTVRVINCILDDRKASSSNRMLAWVLGILSRRQTNLSA